MFYITILMQKQNCVIYLFIIHPLLHKSHHIRNVRICGTAKLFELKHCCQVKYWCYVSYVFRKYCVRNILVLKLIILS